MMIYKVVAEWIPGFKKYMRQLYVSAVSFITLPFFIPKKDGIRKFFISNYYEKQDDLLFDGSTNGYYSKIELLVDFKSWHNVSILDLGSGNGSLYYWLRQRRLSISRYTGIDFSIRNRNIDDCGILKNDDIANAYKYLSGSNDIIFMCNSLCYIEDGLFIDVLNSLYTGSELIIIDPSPNIFWDAHFNGVKPIYRKCEEVASILEEHGFFVEGVAQDYLFRIRRVFLSPLSFCIRCIKK